MRIHLKTLGCRLNEAETESWANDFNLLGHSIINDSQTADIVVLNTCAVTQGAVRKSRQLIRKTQQQNPTAKLVVSGCYATLNEKETVDTSGIDLLVNNQQKDELVKRTLQHLHIESMPAISTEPGEVALFTRGRQRAFIKVQDGCRYRCTFCIVTIARGDEKSKKIKKIIDEVNAVHDSGIQEVVITGVHLGGYGSDINSDLYQLIKALLDNTEIPRIRMGSLEPWDLPDNFFTLFYNPRLMPHMHLPIQSGSNSVLRRMARRCKTEEFRQLVTTAREQVQHLNITTDIIVGFPGETEDEWRQTLAFVEEMEFGGLHIFSYSKREGTKAAGLTQQVDDKIKKSRSQQLHQLAEKIKKDNLQNMLDQSVPVLWEEGQTIQAQEKIYYGYTPHYHRVKTVVSSDIELANKVINSRLSSIEDGVLLSQFL